jgi:exopolysaccharide biosynthesis polyprenyl glycosylphosphotransferase
LEESFLEIDDNANHSIESFQDFGFERTLGCFPYSLEVDVAQASGSFIRRNWRAVSTAIRVGGDIVAVGCANAIALRLHAAHPGGGLMGGGPDLLNSTIFYSTVFLTVAMMAGLYRSTFHVGRWRQYVILLNTYLYTCAVTGLAVGLFGDEVYRHGYLLFFFTYLGPVILLIRSLVGILFAALRERGFGYSEAVILEESEQMERPIADRISRFPELGYRLYRHVLLNGDRSKEKHHIKQFEEALSGTILPTVFVPTIKIGDNGYLPLIELCRSRNIRVMLLSEETDSILRFSHVRDIAGIPIFPPVKRRTQLIKAIVKRGLDIVGSIVGLVLFSPLMLIVSVSILIEDGWPVLYKQKRALIRGGLQFDFFKFRSMKKGADLVQQELYKQNQQSGGLFRIPNDPRLTRVGRLIRKFSVDELPQLINVLKGDMSLVGPRPLTIADLENIAPENRLGGFYELRAKAKPGVTGLWQISGRRDVGFKQMVLLDLYYIENQTVAFDLEILAHTIPVVLFGRGGY